MLGKWHKYHIALWIVSILLLLLFSEYAKQALGIRGTGSSTNWIFWPGLLFFLSGLAYAMAWMVIGLGVSALSTKRLNGDLLEANLFHGAIGAFGGLLSVIGVSAMNGFGSISW